jgi:hypothetical protein
MKDERVSALSFNEECVRQDRNTLLTSCDWTQQVDNALSPEDKLLWTTYRSALRDIPQQIGFPFNVDWPTKP